MNQGKVSVKVFLGAALAAAGLSIGMPNVQAAGCPLTGCMQTEAHIHNSCGIEGCVQMEAHIHNSCGIEGCVQTEAHTHNSCGIEGCMLTGGHTHSYSNPYSHYNQSSSSVHHGGSHHKNRGHH